MASALGLELPQKGGWMTRPNFGKTDVIMQGEQGYEQFYF